MKELNEKYKKYFQRPNINQARKRISDISTISYSEVDQLNSKRHFNNKKYWLKTYGCQANVRDSENIAGILEQIGMIETKDQEEADLIIMNTCAIRDNAEQRVFGQIGLLKQLRYKKPSLMFAICGCMAQEEAVVNRILKSHEHIDLIFGTHNIFQLPSLLVAALFSKDTFVSVWSQEGDVVEHLPSKRYSNIKSFVHVTFGCDHFCTYCIVPITRGKERSRTIKTIVDEVVELKEEGYKEVTLIGQNVNSYGIDLSDEKENFLNLLEEVAKTKIERVRFTTSNPWNFDEKIIDIMSSYKNIMPYIHLPIQSGSEEILKRMNRPMKIQNYIDLVKKAKSRIPKLSLSTDIIVGFPNESDYDFEQTKKLVEECDFDNIYCFIFSPRPGTPAEKFKDEISFKTKKQRLDWLNNFISKRAKIINKSYEGQTMDVLVEGVSKKNKNRLTGYTPNNKVVNFDGSQELIGQVIKVKLTEAKKFSFEGEVVSKDS